MKLTVQNLSFSYERPGKMNLFRRSGQQKSSLLKGENSDTSDPLALDRISLEICDGQILCLMGPNGSGKSTLLNCIIGICKPHSGQVLLDSDDLSRMKRAEIAKRAAYVPQTHTVDFPYTVRDAVLMGRTAYIPDFGEPSEYDLQVCEQAMDRVGILPLADKSYGNISGGELRLVLLARALCQETGLILMDEPTAHLDYHNELYFMEMVSDLCKHDKIAVLMATHAPSQAFYFEHQGNDTHTLFLKKGRMLAEGTPSEVINSELLQEAYGIQTKILEFEGEKTVLLQRSL